jgi:ubiquinone/menaquinone biosynthesis C-methylase UbiE
MALMYHRRKRAATTLQPATRGQLIRWAAFYDPFVSLFTLGRRAELRRTTVALAGIQPGEQVLEVGCGTGDVALAASALVGPRGGATGIDPAPEMIAVARAKAARAARAVSFQVGVIEALAFPDHSFDVVLSSLMMHHLPRDLRRQGLDEIARVLKPGGRLVIVDIKPPISRLDRVLTTLALHAGMQGSLEDLPTMLGAAGFTNIESGQTGFRLLGFVRVQTPR